MTHSNDSRRPRSRVTPLALTVLAALCLMPSGLARAATITVTTVADENGSGPNCSLREAIASANGDTDVGGCVGVGAYGADTIVFASTLSLPATITLTDPAGALTVSSDVTITGPGATELAIDGNHTTLVFSITTGQVMMSDLTIRHGNSASRDDFTGGGIANYGTLTLTNCTLSGNSTSGSGGGISNGYQGTAILTNCTLSDNAASGSGGGISNRNWATAILTNCTLSDNAATFGGGIYNSPGCGGCGPFGSPIEGGRLTLGNTIVANSPSGGDCSGERITDGGHNLIEDATSSCGVSNGVNGNIIGVDPLLSPLANNGGPTQTIALLPGSPAINAGDPVVCANPPVNGVDQRGFARPGSGHTQCSIGAYEADAFSSETCVGDCGGTGSVTINEIITLVNIALGNTQPSACPHGVASGSEVNVAMIIQAVSTARSGCGGRLAEQGCLTSGGTVTSAMCCAGTGDFPGTCAIGACGCAPAASHVVRTCTCSAGCFDGSGCVRP